jgi:hypothetical protein
MIVAGAVVLAVAAARAQSPSATEYQVKAAFLYNFAKFVEWPDDAFPSADAPIQICIAGDNPFGGDLEKFVKTKTVAGRRFRVVQLRAAQQCKSCHILFVSSADTERIPDVIRNVSGGSVLTVGESPVFTNEGGIINFVLENERVRFEVNNRAATAARLRLSSKLLTIAKHVIE